MRKDFCLRKAWELKAETMYPETRVGGKERLRKEYPAEAALRVL